MLKSTYVSLKHLQGIQALHKFFTKAAHIEVEATVTFTGLIAKDKPNTIFVTTFFAVRLTQYKQIWVYYAWYFDLIKI